MTDPVYDPPIDGVAVGHDGSRTAAAALTAAAAEAGLRGCRLHVIRAWSITGAPRPPEVAHGIVPSVAQFAAEVRRRLSADVAAVLGEPRGEVVLHAPRAAAAPALLAAAATADLLVVGTRGLGGVAGLLLGSTSEQVIRHAACPVLVVPSAGSGTG